MKSLLVVVVCMYVCTPGAPKGNIDSFMVSFYALDFVLKLNYEQNEIL